jgi:(2R)-3-sulfolactate dehydrogenase (NADP+)
MSETETLTLEAIEALSLEALLRAGARDAQARPLARDTAMTEAMGVASHGLAYIPIYAEHLRCGKVLGAAVPVVTQPRPGAVVVSAGNGFAHAAIDAGLPQAMELARSQGIAVLAIRDSYNCGVLGVHALRIARAGLVGLCFTNAPASIAPSGGARPVVGTNPIALGAPDGAGGASLLIDQSASAIAKSEVMKHAREGKPIPEGWALDPDGQPTTDPEVGLLGSMAPAGGYKGVGLGLIVETFAAALSGAVLGKDASPFSGPKGGPPSTGQCFVLIDPDATSGGVFGARMAALTQAVTDQPGARLPGVQRQAAMARAAEEGVAVSAATLARVRGL